MTKTALAAAALALISSPLMADTSLSINIELDDDAVLTTTRYDCGGGGEMQVLYISGEDDALALVPVDGDDDERVFVNVMAASGARYVAAQYEWWSKGQNATLTDLMNDKVLMDCTAIN